MRKITDIDFDNYDFMYSTCSFPKVENDVVSVHVKNFQILNDDNPPHEKFSEATFEFIEITYIVYNHDGNVKKKGDRSKSDKELYLFGSSLESGGEIEMEIWASECRMINEVLSQL